MMELNTKYVFHMPVYKYIENRLVLIEYDKILDDLIDQLNKSGFNSLYMAEVKGYYKSRSFDELLITLFCSSKESPEIIFKKWFIGNNDILEQESFAYECNNSMFIEEL